MHHPVKRQRTLDEHGMASPNREHVTPCPLHGCGRQLQSGAGGNLRLDVASSLNRTEADILGLMIEAVNLSKKKTVVRVAGGWVRDKLLGLENEDIDVALDDCTGVAFAEVVNFYLKSTGRDEGKVAVIEANPEQSKHLQTARMKIMGVWIDLVNLRTETYRSDNRIPETSFGTAEDDALRRDFTLNALFFNVNDGKVEDMTGRGIDDLRDGIIRTPLPPMLTFQDDPLRLMRAVRFAARFGFTLHEDLRAAAQDSNIQAALGSKVSRERVGAELAGMLIGKRAQPALALSLLQELGLSATVYDPPQNPIPASPEGGYDWARGAAVARAASRVLKIRAAGVSATGEGVNRAGDENEVQKPSSPLPAVVAAIESAETAPSDGTAVVEGDGSTAAAVVGVMAGDEAAPTVLSTAAGEAESESTRMVEAKGGSKAASEEKTEPQKAEGVSCGGRGEGDDPTTLVRELFLCAALLPLAGVQHTVKKEKLAAAAQSVVRESLKFNSKDAKKVADILEFAPTFRSLADAYAATTPSAVAGALAIGGGGGGADTEGEAGFSRLAVGLAVRQARELWPTCVTLCCAVEMCEAQDEGRAQTGVEESAATGSTCTSNVSTGKETRGDESKSCAEQAVESQEGGNGSEPAIIEKYIGFEKAVVTMGLGKAWDMAPLIRGNELMVILQVPKGPEIGKLIVKQVSWQLEHPEGTREECIAFLRAAL